MTSVLAPVRFDAPLVNPSPGGLFNATQWTEATEGPLRWLPSGVEVRPWNYGFEESFGVWAASWDAVHSDLDLEDDVKKAAERPDPLPSFAPITSWAADECDLMAPSRDEARTRVAQVHRLREPIAVEQEFAARLLDDADTPVGAANLVAAVVALEDLIAGTNTMAYIHARPGWIHLLAEKNLLVRSGAGFQTLSGHKWVFGGGYVEGLEDVLVATSQPFGWRGPVEIRTAEDLKYNRLHAIAERSLVIGYEALIAAVEVG